MKKEFTMLLLFSGLILLSTPSCEKHYANGSTEEEQDDNGTDGTEDASDYVWSASDIVYITLNTTSITVIGTGASVDGSKVTITSAGTYSISGTLSNGQVIVNTGDDGAVRLILNSVNITCSSSSPVYVKKAAKVIVVLAEGTVNYLTDGTSYVFDDTENQEPNATIFSKSYISFCGTGSLNINSKFNDGVSGKDGMVVKSGTLTITSVDDGIRGKDYLIVRDGNITVTSTGDGLKSDNEDDTSLGYITIEKGVIHITSGGDAISALTNVNIAWADMEIKSGGGSGTGTSASGYAGAVSAKGIKATSAIVISDGVIAINSADDALHTAGNFTQNGGTVTISTMDDAVHAEGILTANGGTTVITKCYEGFEGPSINVKGGNVSIVSTDDSFNATKGTRTETDDGSVISITGGTIVLNSSNGDGFDSNGSAAMSGGTVVSHGPSQQPNVAIDVNGSFNVSAGLLLGAGPNAGNMIEATSTTSGQYCILAKTSSTLSSGTLVNIKDSGGNSLVTFKPVRSIYYIVYSSPDLLSGSTYSIYTGGSSTGTNNGGLITGGTYSGGTLKKSFTVSSKVTNVTF